MEKRKFRIGELARALSQGGVKVEPSVIRFWEKEFCVESRRSEKGQRYYSEEDFRFFLSIQELLYKKKFTIEGARRILKGRSKGIFANAENAALQPVSFVQFEQLVRLRELLFKLKKLL